MTIEEMHYDFKVKFNKVDSQQYRNMLIPEIDWLLNEAAEIFVKIVAQPRYRTKLGFETSQRNTDDIKNIVLTDVEIPVDQLVAPLPTDYWYFVRANVVMDKDNCQNVVGDFHLRQHDDDFENSPFDRSSFEWRTVNGVFSNTGVKFYTDGTFTITTFVLSYIKRLEYMHNAKQFTGGNYRLPSGILLENSVNCELPEHTHREIVDIAVAIASGQIQVPDYQIKLNKLNFNNLN